MVAVLADVVITASSDGIVRVWPLAPLLSSTPDVPLHGLAPLAEHKTGLRLTAGTALIDRG